MLKQVALKMTVVKMVVKMAEDLKQSVIVQFPSHITTRPKIQSP